MKYVKRLGGEGYIAVNARGNAMYRNATMENPKTYYCFTRTWWKSNPTWPNDLEPCAGKRRTKAKNLTYAEARAYCEQWNATHKPGRLSLKCEFDEQRR